MKGVFVAPGIALAAYVAYGIAVGEIIVRSGPGARRLRRDQTPRYFWLAIAIYTLLAIALVTVF